MTSSITIPSTDPAPFDSHPCYHDGTWGPFDQVHLSINDRGFRQGVTAVERLRTYGGKPFCVDQHLRRWDATVEALGIPSVRSTDGVSERLGELIERNAALIASEGDVGITLFATPGVGSSGVGSSGGSSPGKPTLCLHLNALDHPRNQQRCTHGQPLVVTNVQQPSPACWPRSLKVRSRIHYHLADTIARQRDPQALGLLLDEDGSITETSIANVAIVESGTIVSPIPEQVLGGVTAAVMESLAKASSIDWHFDRIMPDRLRSADEVWLMGTDTGLGFVNQVDGQPVGTGTRGPICHRLQVLFEEYVKHPTQEQGTR